MKSLVKHVLKLRSCTLCDSNLDALQCFMELGIGMTLPYLLMMQQMGLSLGVVSSLTKTVMLHGAKTSTDGCAFVQA